MKKKSTINSKIGAIAVMLLLVVYILNIVPVPTQIIIQTMIYWVLAAMAMFVVVMRRKIKKHILALLLFALYIVMITVQSQHMNSSVFYINFGYMTLWIWVIVLFEFVNEKKDFNESLFKLITWFSILIGIFVSCNYGVRNKMLDFGFANNSYYLLCALPIILLIKKRWLRVSALIVACVTVFLSLKRTSILSLIFTGIVCILYYSRGESRGLKIRRSVFVLILVLLFVLTQFDSITSLLGINVFKRFEMLSQDGGSGRIEIYMDCIKTIREGGLFRFLFGCGYNGLIKFYGNDVSSHNDFLELLIDYGIIGLTFYLGIIWRYIKSCLYCIKHHTQYAGACITSLCAFTFVSFFGHCVIYPSYFMMLLIFWTYIESKVKEMKVHRTCIVRDNYFRKKDIYEDRNINLS